MKNLPFYPLWVIVTIWWLLSKQGERAMRVDYDKLQILLVDLLDAVARIEERDRISTWLVRRLIGWYDRQHKALLELRERKVSLVGTLEK